jgi:hypothetical protein
MVKSSSDAFNFFVRGGQVLGHAMVMAGQEAKRYLFFVLCWCVACIVRINLRVPWFKSIFKPLDFRHKMLVPLSGRRHIFCNAQRQ